MPNISEQTLGRQIKEGAFLPCYLFYGSEPQAARLRAKQLLSRAVPAAARGFNLSRFNGEQLELSDLETAAATAPLMAERRAVFVDGLRPEQLDKKDLARLKKLPELLPDTTVLLLLVSNPELSPKSSSPLRQLSTACAKVGGVVEFGQRDPATLAKQLVAAAAKRECILSKDAAYELVKRVGSSQLRLGNELDKLCAYVGTGEITKQTVRLLTNEEESPRVFELAKHLLRGNRKEAFSLLDSLFDHQSEPLIILGALNMAFVDLYRAKVAQSAGQDANAITDHYSYKGKEFRIRNAMRDCSRASLPHLRHCLRLLSDLDERCKTTRLNQRTLLEETMVCILEQPL